MAEQRAAPHPTSMEAGQQCLFPESIGVKRGRAPPPIAPARLAPAASSVPERVKLTELAALAEMADDETVAALRSIVSPGHAGSSTCSPAQASHRGGMPAQASQQQMQSVIVQSVRHLPIALACSTSLQHLAGFGADASELHFLFARLFTPKHPSTLPKSQWLSYTRLFLTVQPYAPARVWKQGRGNLKQLVIEWCQHHPVFAGLAQSAWCMRLKDDDQPQAGRKQLTVYKFCLACSTPHDG